MDEKDFKGRKVAIDLGKANVFSVALMVIAAVVLLVPFFMIWGSDGLSEIMDDSGNDFLIHWGIFMIAMMAGIVIHELIHGITWAHYAKMGWKSISFGVLWKMLTPYCHCNEPLHRQAYIMGAVMPCLVLGVLPAIVALCTGSLSVMIWAIIFIAAASGDLWMTWLILKENPNGLFLDHPSEAGFFVLDEEAV